MGYAQDGVGVFTLFRGAGASGDAIEAERREEGNSTVSIGCAITRLTTAMLMASFLINISSVVVEVGA
jgi:hypothetical protein